MKRLVLAYCRVVDEFSVRLWHTLLQKLVYREMSAHEAYKKESRGLYLGYFGSSSGVVLFELVYLSLY